MSPLLGIVVVGTAPLAGSRLGGMTIQITGIGRWIDGFLADTTLPDLILRKFDNPDSPVFYWYRVLWDSLHQTFELVWGRGWTSAIIAVVIFVASILIHHWFWGRHALKEKSKPAVPGAVGVLTAGAAVFLVMVLNNAFSLYDEQRVRAETAGKTDEEIVKPDTPEQAEARLDLYAFHAEYLIEAYSQLVDYASDVHLRMAGKSALPRQLDQDPSPVLGRLLDAYRETGIEAAHSGIVDVFGGREEVSFDELMQRFANYYRSYTDLAEWTQRAALTVSEDTSGDAGYREWNAIDDTFISELRALTAQPALVWLREQIAEYGVEDGPWDVFRIRNIEAENESQRPDSNR